jgi:hypothetical protein
MLRQNAGWYEMADRVARLALADRADGSLAIYDRLKALNIEPTPDLVNKCLPGGISPDSLAETLPTQETPRKVVIWP